MPLIDQNASGSDALDGRAEILFRYHLIAIHQRVDRLFAGLLMLQWLISICTALWISPLAWDGTESQIHIHVWTALALSGLIVCVPVYLAIHRSDLVITRHVIGIAQMLMGAMLIHLSGGRLETHFHVFGSLALLAFYRDWRVLITSSTVVVIDHYLRGLLWPLSIYGSVMFDPWRWLEHAAWVLLEDLFLIQSCVLSIREMRTIARRQAQLESTQVEIEQTVRQRTFELNQRTELLEKTTQRLSASQEQFRGAFDFAPIGMAVVSLDGLWLRVSIRPFARF